MKNIFLPFICLFWSISCLADSDITCLSSSCLSAGWTTTDIVTGSRDRTQCTSSDCATNGWTTTLASGATTTTTCSNDGDCFTDGYTETRFDNDLQENVEISVVKCRAAQSGAKTCHGKGWRDFGDDGIIHVSCINGDCGAYGWVSMAKGKLVSTTQCKNSDCFGKGYITQTATYAMTGDKAPDYAEVVNVEEITETVNTPREVCEDVAVTRKAPVKDENKIAGTAIGAVVGGLLGNQIGGGTGKKIATVAGAVGGGYAGNTVQGNMQDKDTYTTTERVCQTVTDSHQNVVGYNVTYMIGDKEGTVRMDKKPGNRIPVENGKLLLN